MVFQGFPLLFYHNFALITLLTNVIELYATETYYMHFLEPAQFINAPDLAGCKVNVLYNPGLAERPPSHSTPNTTPGP